MVYVRQINKIIPVVISVKEQLLPFLFEGLSAGLIVSKSQTANQILEM